MLDPSSFDQQDTLFHDRLWPSLDGARLQRERSGIGQGSYGKRPNGRGDVAAVQGVACVQRSRMIVTEEASHGKCRKSVFWRSLLSLQAQPESKYDE